MGFSVLVVDADRSVREALAEFVRREGYSASAVDSGERALAELKDNPCSFLVVDLKLPRLNGMETVIRARALVPDIIVVVMVGLGTIDSAVEVLKAGAYATIMKPFNAEELLCILKRGRAEIDSRARIKGLETALEAARAIETADAEIDLGEGRGVDRTRLFGGISEAALRLVGGEVVVIHVAQNAEGAVGDVEFVEASRLVSFQAAAYDIGDLGVYSLLRYHDDDKALLVTGTGTRPFFERQPGVAVSALISVPLRIHLRLVGAITVYALDESSPFTESHRRTLTSLATRAARYVDFSARFLDLDRSAAHTLLRLVAGFENSAPPAAGVKSDAIARIADSIAASLDLPAEEAEQVVCAARLLRIGDYLIAPAGASSSSSSAGPERAYASAEEGERVISAFPTLARAAMFIRSQEERWDGSGGPDQLARDAIPIGTRIVAVAKAFAEARERCAAAEGGAEVAAIGEIRRAAGVAFDPMVVAALEIETFGSR